jgi:hypothetical protein
MVAIMNAIANHESFFNLILFLFIYSFIHLFYQEVGLLLLATGPSQTAPQLCHCTACQFKLQKLFELHITAAGWVVIQDSM